MTAMREFWNKRTVRIIISILVALVIWVYVDSQDTEPRTVRVNNIPVEFTGEDVLMERGLLVTSDMNITIDLELSSSNRTVINNLDRGKDEIRLRVRLDRLWADIQENGETELFTQSEKAAPYERERPAARLFTATDKNYQSAIKQLAELAPPEARTSVLEELRRE